MPGNIFNDIDFEHLASLASSDPQKFEQLRRDKISAIIEKTQNQKRRQRLLGLQWQIDQIREQHKDSAMAACLAISGLMWDTFEHLSGLLQQQAEKPQPLPAPRYNAKIIPFPQQRQR